jgi:hypothetical protein
VDCDLEIEKMLRGRVKNRAGHLFRLAAFSRHHSLTPLGNYLRRMKTKLGPLAATMATAHKIAVIFYTMVKNQVEYDQTLWAASGRKGSKQNSNGKPNNWATNLSPSNPRLHNEPVQRAGSSLEAVIRHCGARDRNMPMVLSSCGPTFVFTFCAIATTTRGSITLKGRV